MKGRIDTLEKGFAIIQLPSRSYVNLPIELVPFNGKEGDTIEIVINETETAKYKSTQEKLVD
ncbi:MAG: DUF3006 family protein [Clostridia bacterium]|nr:DUF3006 family protein [Clostridia bacterium]